MKHIFRSFINFKLSKIALFVLPLILCAPMAFSEEDSFPGLDGAGFSFSQDSRPSDTAGARPNSHSLIADEYIKTVLMTKPKKMTDINRDDLTNCIDYATYFKSVRDIIYPDNRADCEIVRNVNKNTGMNHLFVRVRFYQTWVYVEPQGSTNNYDMYRFWGDKYNSIYNIYGESEKWLREVRLGYKNIRN